VRVGGRRVLGVVDGFQDSGGLGWDLVVFGWPRERALLPSTVYLASEKFPVCFFLVGQSFFFEFLHVAFLALVVRYCSCHV